MDDLENVYELNRYLYMHNRKIFKYKKYCIAYDCEKKCFI